MTKRIFGLAVALIICVMFLVACEAPAEFNFDNKNDSYVSEETDQGDTNKNETDRSPVTQPGIESYRSQINAHQNLFQVSLIPHTSNMNMAQVDIKNISSKRYSDVLLNLLFTDKEGNVLKTCNAGVYSNIYPQDTVNIYLKDFDASSNGYVIGYKESYFATASF